MDQKVSLLNQYSGFDNVSIVPMCGKTNRFFDFENNPFLLEMITKELSLTEVEKECFLEYRNQEFDYLAFHGWPPRKDFCSFMSNVFNIAIAYTDMVKLFCEAYSKHQGNVLSNSNFLYNLLSCEGVRSECVKNFSELTKAENFDIKRKKFSGKYCSYCKSESKGFLELTNSINIKKKAIEIFLPDYSKLEIDDLYEIQQKAKTEIEQLAFYIDEISKVANSEEELERLVKSRIKPSVLELKAKVKGLRLISLQKALEIRNIAEIPVLCYLLPDLPGYVPIALSAAFVAADVGIEMRKEHINLKQHPMYFTIKLNKLAQRKRER